MHTLLTNRRSTTLVVLGLVLALLIGACSASDAEPATGNAAAEEQASNGADDAATDTGSDPATTPSPASADDASAEAGAGADDPAFRTLPPAGGVPAPAEAGPAPVGFQLPDLDIADAVVLPVGVDAAGDFEVPEADEIGWYRFGSAPGEGGSTVLAAHIAYDGVDGVFRWLASVEIGSEVEVVMDDGTTLTYRITDKVRYDKDELPVEELFDESGPDRLVLITCGGSFNPSLSSYESNDVVFAEPIT